MLTKVVNVVAALLNNKHFGAKGCKLLGHVLVHQGCDIAPSKKIMNGRVKAA